MNNSGLTLIFLMIAFVAMVAGMSIARRRRIVLRPIPAYVVLPELSADAVESNYLVHFSMGSSAIGETSTLSALAATEVIYRMSERLAVSRQTPLLTLSHPLTLPLAQDTLRRAFEYRQQQLHYRTSAAAWFPQGPRSLAFAAGAASLAADANVTSTVALGQFGIELVLLGESALRTDQDLLAHSDLLEGQAVAFVQAKQALIGEELYVGPAYMGGKPLELSGAIALDVLRWLVILGILVIALQAAV